MSAGTLALILNFAFVLILVVGFLIGLWRGVKKASLNLGITLVGVLVGFFVSGPITKAVLGINIGGQTISQYIVNLITQNADIKLLYDSTPSLQQTVAGLPYALVTPIMFLIVSLAIMLVTYLIYRIFACFIKKKDKEGNKIKQYRIAGGAVGLVKALILTLFISMPLVSLIGTANDLLNPPEEKYVSATEATEGKDNGPLASVVPKLAVNIIDGLDTSAFGVLGNMFGLDNATFDYLSTFEINDEKIQIRKEIDNIAQVYTVYEVFVDAFSSSEIKFEDINFAQIDKRIESLLNSKFYKTVISDSAFNLLSDSQDYSFFNGLREGQFSEIFEQISNNISNYTGAKSDYFTNDINNLYSAVKTLAQAGTLDKAFKGNDDIMDTIKALAEKPEKLEAALGDVFATNLFQASAPAVINFAIDNLELEIEKVEMEVEKVDWTETNKHLAENFTSLINIYSKMDVNITEVLKSPESLLTKDSQVDIVSLFGNLGQMIDQINNMKIYNKPTAPESEETQPESKPLFVNAEGKSIVEALLKDNQFTIPETLANLEKYKPENQERYKNFFTYLAEPLARVQELDLYSMINGGADANALLKTFAIELAKDAEKQQAHPEEDIENTLELIILRLYDIPKTNEIIIPKLKSMNNSLVDFNQLNSRADWENDIEQISNLLVTLNKDAQEGQTYLDLALDNSKALLNRLSDKQEGDITITQVLTPVLSAKSMTNLKGSIFTILNEVLSDILGESVTVSAEQATKNNAERVCKVFESFIELNSVYQSGKHSLQEILTDTTGREKIVALKDVLAESSSSDDIFYSLYTSLQAKLEPLLRQ